MSLNHRQQHQLYRIESRLGRSEPHLAAMLTVFNTLAAGQCLPAWEQIPSRRDRVGRAITQAIVVLAATAIALTRAVLALITAPFARRRSCPPTPKPERAARDRETGDSQDPEPRPLGLSAPGKPADGRNRQPCLGHDAQGRAVGYQLGATGAGRRPTSSSRGTARPKYQADGQI